MKQTKEAKEDDITKVLEEVKASPEVAELEVPINEMSLIYLKRRGYIMSKQVRKEVTPKRIECPSCGEDILFPNPKSLVELYTKKCKNCGAFVEIFVGVELSVSAIEIDKEDLDG